MANGLVRLIPLSIAPEPSAEGSAIVACTEHLPNRSHHHHERSGPRLLMVFMFPAHGLIRSSQEKNMSLTSTLQSCPSPTLAPLCSVFSVLLGLRRPQRLLPLLASRPDTTPLTTFRVPSTQGRSTTHPRSVLLSPRAQSVSSSADVSVESALFA